MNKKDEKALTIYQFLIEIVKVIHKNNWTFTNA